MAVAITLRIRLARHIGSQVKLTFGSNEFPLSGQLLDVGMDYLELLDAGMTRLIPLASIRAIIPLD